MWPGTGHARLAGSSPGGLVWSSGKLSPIVAREQEGSPRLYPADTRQIYSPLLTTTGHPPTQTSEWWEDARSHFNLPFAELDDFLSLVEEACSVDSPAAIDPCRGKCVLINNEDIVFTDQDLVAALGPSHEPEKYWIGSPVLQLLPDHIVRTRRGVRRYPETDEDVFIYEGESVDAHKLGNNIIILTLGGQIRIRAVQSGDDIAVLSVDRGSVSGWGRVRLLNSGILWCNRIKLAFLEKGDNEDYNYMWRNIIEFPDHEEEIRGLWTDERDAFVLTTSGLIWIDMYMEEKRPILTVEHAINEEDRTLDLQATRLWNLWVITVSSALRPLTMVFTLGRTWESLPYSARDPYFVPTWPTIMPQSHTTKVRSNNELEVYFVPFEGGLYRQIWTQDISGKDMTCPQPDVVVNEPQQTVREDWVKKQADPELEPWNFANLHHYIYNLGLPSFCHQIEEVEGAAILPYMGFKSRDDLSTELARFWMDPAMDKKDSIMHLRRRALECIVEDLDALKLDLNPSKGEHELSSETKELLNDWEDVSGPIHQEEYVASSPIDDVNFLTQLPSSSQLSQIEGQISSSQPLPVIRDASNRKKRKKHKRSRRGEGFV